MDFSKEQLKAIYENNTNVEAANIIGVSVPTLLKMVNENGIEMKGSGRPYRKRKSEGEKIDVWLSTNTTDVLNGDAFSIGCFSYLVSDKELAKKGWNGKSKVNINGKFFNGEIGRFTDTMESWKRLNIISSYSIDNDGFISIHIIDRKRFVLLPGEYDETLENEGAK